MKRDEDVVIKEYFVLTDDILQTLVELDQAIFDQPIPAQEFKNIFSCASDVIILIAQKNNQPIGFKIGHRLKHHTFYSMFGGVLSEHRQMGVARALMEHQHKILMERGYKTVRTHTRNKFKDMLIFNLSFGFEVIGVSQSLDSQELSIILEMKL